MPSVRGSRPVGQMVQHVGIDEHRAGSERSLERTPTEVEGGVLINALRQQAMQKSVNKGAFKSPVIKGRQFGPGPNPRVGKANFLQGPGSASSRAPKEA